MVRVKAVLNRTVVDDSDWRVDNLYGSHLQSQKVICITSVDGIKLWLLTWLVNQVAMLLVVCQLNRDVIGYEDSYWLTVKHVRSFIFSQIVSCPVVLISLPVKC